MKILIKNGTVLIDGKKRIDNGAVLVENQKIIGVYKDYSHVEYDECVDAKGKYIVPGLIETHTHGIIGHDFNECTKEQLQEISDASLKEGVTCFMASLVCEEHERMLELLDMYEESDVKNMLGVHIEGPFLSLAKKAVMKEECLCPVNVEKFKEYIESDKILDSDYKMYSIDDESYKIIMGIDLDKLKNNQELKIKLKK